MQSCSRVTAFPTVQSDSQIGACYLACRAFAVTRRQCTVHQTALRNCCVLFHRMAGETGGGSRGCDPDSALGRGLRFVPVHLTSS